MIQEPSYRNKIAFNGITKFVALTDVHQNSGGHARILSKAMEYAKKTPTVVLDNGDNYMGPYPEDLQFSLYKLALEKMKDLKVVFNMGNNDFGYRELDKSNLLSYRKLLNKLGVNVISTNTVQKGTNIQPEGIKKYAIVESDKDKLLYLGFSVEGQLNSETIAKPALATLEEIEPELKQVIKTNGVNGVVVMLHDGMELAKKIQQKIQNMGMDLKFIIGGHIHETPQAPNIFFPKPFAMGADIFDLNIDKFGKSEILNHENALSKNFTLSNIYKNILSPIEKKEGFQQDVIPNIKHRLSFSWETPKTSQSSMGTVYANGIKNITGAEIGIVGKGWIWQGIERQNNPFKKIELLFAIKRPEPKIQLVDLTPSQLKKIIEEKVQNNDYFHEYSSNINLVIDESNKKIKQIYINNSKLLDESGNVLDDNKKIKCAIDYFSISNRDFDVKESKYSMYDGFLSELKHINESDKPVVPNKFEIV